VIAPLLSLCSAINTALLSVRIFHHADQRLPRTWAARAHDPAQAATSVVALTTVALESPPAPPVESLAATTTVGVAPPAPSSSRAVNCAAVSTRDATGAGACHSIGGASHEQPATPIAATTLRNTLVIPTIYAVRGIVISR